MTKAHRPGTKLSITLALTANANPELLKNSATNSLFTSMIPGLFSHTFRSWSRDHTATLLCGKAGFGTPEMETWQSTLRLRDLKHFLPFQSS